MLNGVPSVAEALESSLWALEGHWLEVTCSGCGSLSQYPLKLMALRQGRRHKLGDVVPRLVCGGSSCRALPRSVYLCETPNRTFCYGAQPGWSVDLSALVKRVV